MKKLLTILMLLALAVPAWAGTQTITISRNDGEFENSTGVYYASKGGVTMTMSGGLNNKNYLVLRHENTITFKSANFAIKEIIFHCLDNFPSTNLDVFYWGPTTMNVMTVNYKPVGSSTTTAVTPGKYTASGYDGHWVSSFSGTWTSTFKGVTRTHTSFANGYPAGNTLTFESMGKPIRFSSIDIIVEKEDGDIYDLVTSIDQVQNNHNYLIVNWNNSKALSVNTKEGRVNEQVRTGSPVEFISGHVDDSGLYDQYAKVKTDGEAQIIKFEKHSLPISNASGPINNDRPWLLNAGGNYLRITSTASTTTDGNKGPDVYGVSSIDDEWSYTKVDIEDQSKGYNARIRYRAMSSTSFPRPTSSGYRIGYNKTNNYFRDLDEDYSGVANQNVRLYTPAQNYNVTTEVLPDASKGCISLPDGVIVNDASATSGTSQQYETVSFLVNPADGYKISNVTIQAGSSTIEPENVTITTNGILYTYVMPASDVHIIAEFAEVEYHNVYIEVKPSADYGGVFLTNGYVVQNDQVKSYEGANVEFNVTPNLIDIDDESKGYHELYSVTVTYTEGGQTISYTYTDGNYNFTMPDADVTITATFIYENGNPLYLLGSANGKEFLPYGPRFNYDNNNQEYYIDVYFKGANEFGGNSDDAYGFFCLSWGKWSTWEEVNQQTRRGQPYDNNYLISTDNPQYTLCYDDNRQNAFKIPAGIYRIKVKSYGYHNDVLSIERTYPKLTFDPAGGTAENPEIVSKGSLLTLNGDLYNKIKAINPDEADANFMYKATPSIDGTAQAVQTESAGASTTQIATLDVVNEGETVTKLEGWNYLGWIVANNTGYYKVIDTPLHWIEEFGKKDNTYTVSDRLQGVYAKGTSLWCKDLGDDDNKDGISIVKTTPNQGQVDFLMNDDHCKRVGGWDQSNWVELDFSGFDDGETRAQAGVEHYIDAGSITGEYTDDVNYKIKVKSNLSLTEAPEYVPNHYCTANFIEGNLKIGENVGPTIGNTTYYFLNPKIQEYAIITYAMWDKPNQIMVIPNNNPFSGAARIGMWDLNEYGNQLENLDAAALATPNNQYEFHIIVQRNDKTYGSPATRAIKPNQAASTVIKIQPLDLQASSPMTAINTVGTEAQVVGIEYVNVSGVRSSKPFKGVNIVVTRYSDGSTTTSKIIK